jgi:predicted Zn finger-like uncharacterized protein
VFRIAQAQLEIADGLVRCGFCKKIFHARAEELTDSNKPDDKLSDTLPSHAQQAQTIAETDTDQATFSSTADDDVVAVESEAWARAKPYSTTATAAWSLAILVLIATLITEYLWFNQPELLQHTQLKPLTTQLCEWVDCERLQMRDPSQIELISRNVYTHPNEKKALMVTSTMVNHASYAQPYPDVQIDFSDIRGELVASRRFTPGEYLQTDETPLSLLQSGTPVTFGLEIQDPGNQAITYEFSFH